VTQNFKGICYGDANASYVPLGDKSLAANRQGTITLESVDAAKGDITVPVTISDMTNLGSFQFTVQYDASKLTLDEVSDWYQDIDGVTIGTPAPGLITFVWAGDVTGVTITDGVLCNLHFTSNSAETSPLEFVTAPTSQEFGDFDGVIFEPQAVNGTLKSTTGIGESDQATLNIYPNPASGQATVTYSVPSAKDVTITILNLLGQEVSTILNAAEQNAGTYNVSFDVNGLNPGIYYCRLSVNNKLIVKKLIVNK
jgi:hypothetical protein